VKFDYTRLRLQVDDHFPSFRVACCEFYLQIDKEKEEKEYAEKNINPYLLSEFIYLSLYNELKKSRC
jgi:hypothetical protein